MKITPEMTYANIQNATVNGRGTKIDSSLFTTTLATEFDALEDFYYVEGNILLDKPRKIAPVKNKKEIFLSAKVLDKQNILINGEIYIFERVNILTKYTTIIPYTTITETPDSTAPSEDIELYCPGKNDFGASYSYIIPDSTTYPISHFLSIYEGGDETFTSISLDGSVSTNFTSSLKFSNSILNEFNVSDFFVNSNQYCYIKSAYLQYRNNIASEVSAVNIMSDLAGFGYTDTGLKVSSFSYLSTSDKPYSFFYRIKKIEDNSYFTYNGEDIYFLEDKNIIFKNVNLFYNKDDNPLIDKSSMETYVKKQNFKHFIGTESYRAISIYPSGTGVQNRHALSISNNILSKIALSPGVLIIPYISRAAGKELKITEYPKRIHTSITEFEGRTLTHSIGSSTTSLSKTVVFRDNINFKKPYLLNSNNEEITNLNALTSTSNFKIYFPISKLLTATNDGLVDFNDTFLFYISSSNGVMMFSFNYGDSLNREPHFVTLNLFQYGPFLPISGTAWSIDSNFSNIYINFDIYSIE